MKIKSWALLAVIFLVGPAQAGADESEDWISLFNGKDLSGWKLANEAGPNGWTVHDGVYVNSSSSTDILTERQFTDFHLHVEFNLPKGSNSGVYLRGNHEIQIFDSFGKKTLSHSDCGSIYGVAIPAANASKPPGEWQTFDVTLIDRRLIVFHNGICIHNHLDLGAEAEPGPILLQGNHGEVSYRNLRIKPLTRDYVTKAKLYVLNSRVDDAAIISIPEHEIIGHVKVGIHPHGIAINAAQTRVFMSSEGEDFLSVIDAATDKVLKRIDAGPQPNEIACTPDGRLLYVPSGGSPFYEVVDVEQGKIIAKIETGGSPHNVVCSTDGKHMFLSPVGDANKIFVVETDTHQVIDTIALENEGRPIALSRDSRRLYIQRTGLLGFELADVSDPSNSHIVHTVHIELTPEQEKVPPRRVPVHGIGLPLGEKEVWVCDANHSLVVVFDITVDPPEQIVQIPTKSHPDWLTFSPDGKYCYVSNPGTNVVQVVEVATHETVKWIDMGKGPEKIVVKEGVQHVAPYPGKGPKRVLPLTVPQF